MLKRCAVALLALLLVCVLGVSPVAAHRGPPGHGHAEPRPPTQNVPPVANDLAILGALSAVSLVNPVAFAAVVVIGAVKIINDSQDDG